MTDQERIIRQEFLIRLLVEYISLLEVGEPTSSLYNVLSEYCDMHDIRNPFLD